MREDYNKNIHYLNEVLKKQLPSKKKNYLQFNSLRATIYNQ